MYKHVLLSDIFDGICPHEQCVYNENGHCTMGEHVSDYMSYRHNKDSVVCRGFTCKKGMCETCGGKLELVAEHHIIDGRLFTSELYVCEECRENGTE